LTAKSAIEIALYAGVIPAAVALAGCLLLGWLLGLNAARRYVPGAAFAIAVFTGFALLPGTTSFAPSQFWEWAPYLGLLAALVAGVTGTDGLHRFERWVSTLIVCALAAWLVVPSWEDLVPSRQSQGIALTLGMFSLAILLEPLAKRIRSDAFALWLLLPAATVSICVMAHVSETLGILAALPAGALAGCFVAALTSKASSDASSLALPYAAVIGTYAYAGYVYPTPPPWPLLLAPAAPLALWLTLIGPLARYTGTRAGLQAVCVALPLAVIAAFFLLGGDAGEAEG